MDNDKEGGGDAEKVGKEDTQGNIWSSEGGRGMENKNKWRNTTVISEAGHSYGNKKGKNEMGRACTKNAKINSGKENFHWTTRGQQEEGKAQTELGGRSGGISEENRNKRMEKDDGG
jgi:hypothetical protein